MSKSQDFRDEVFRAVERSVLKAIESGQWMDFGDPVRFDDRPEYG